ncbi:hypothetical protein HFZ78_13655 [Priestia megaterium]|uniref:Uncharacterized protein n=1 Tax=Priestia megaterium TaxID=1404 RepID=A0A6H1P235_PRIMG|nr:hypothetical protein [Priestia megaterium]QIZ07650.1 hypothetical protein HFZ78_13655 [Priestia megaterium]
MANELFIMTGVRIQEMIEEGDSLVSRTYHGKDEHYEVLVEDKSFRLVNSLLVGKYGSLIISAKNLKTALKVFESVKLLLAFCDYVYDEDMALYRLEKDLRNGDNLKIYDLYHQRNTHERDFLENGVIIGTLRFKKLEELLKLIFRDNRLRTALACFYQAQETYYTHLVGSYITMHSRLDLHYYETDEYSFLNAINYEKFCSSLTSAYRGIEAIMDYNFRERIFENDHYKRVINDRIQGVKWDTRYLKAFDKVRYGDLNKKSYARVSTMIKKLLIARNRAGHGKVFSDQKKNNPITMELTHESKRFLEFLIIEYIDSQIKINEI